MKVINSRIIKFISRILILFCILSIFYDFILNIKEISKEQNIIYIDDIILTEEEQEILNLINKQRVKNGLKELKVYSELQRVAKIKAQDLVNNKYFSHTSPTLGTPFEMLQEEGVAYKYAGENLAGNRTAVKAVTAWMNSKPHKDNILDDNYEYTGIAVVDSEVYGKVYVQLFIGL